MSRSRIAASFFLSFLLFSAPALAQTTAAAKDSFKDACKAGYTYLIVPSATGVSVREAQRVDCTAKDATGALVNRATRECSQNIGDIYWDCRAGLTEGTYKCEHKTCKNGEAISNPATNSPPSPLTPSSQMQLPDVLIQEQGTTALPPLSRQSILDALQQAPSNMGQESIVPRSTAADSFERFMLQAGLAPGTLVPGTGNPDAGTPLSQTPGASDAAQLQGGIVSSIPATRVQTSQEERGAGGYNTFAPTRSAQFAEARPTTWEDRVSTFLGCTVGYFFGGCDSAEARPQDSEVRQQNITLLSVKQNNADAAPSLADLDTMTPAQLKEIEGRILADRYAQVQISEAKRIPQTPNGLRVLGEAFGVLGGRSTEGLKIAWKDYVSALDNNSRANPVIPVEVAELSPIAGSERDTAPAENRPVSVAVDADVERQRAIAERVVAQKRQEIEAARAELQARTDAYIRSTRALGYDDITQGAAWPTYEQWWKEYEERVDAFTAKVDAYRSGDRDVVRQIDAAARTSAGGTSEEITRTIDSIRRNSDDIWNQTPSFWEDPASATFGGATRLAEQALVGTLEAGRNLAERTGLFGETLGFSDPERAVGRIFDPVGANDELAKDTALIVGTTVAPGAAGRVAGLFERNAWTALPRSVTTDVRLAVEDSAGFPTRLSRSSAESGSLGVSAGTRATLDESVWNQTKGSWTAGATITGGILCLGFCPPSEPLPQEAIPTEVVALSREDLALLFPQDNNVQEPSVPRQSSPQAADAEQYEIAQLEKERVDMNLPSPAIVPPDAQPVVTSGIQGVGPLSSDDIAQGLLPNPSSEGSRRKDLEINFESGSARLLKDGREQVAALAQAMSRDEFRNSTFTIVGHTDTVGTPESNLILSRQRAQAIVDILHRDYGIPLDQMKATGAGQWVLKVPVLGNVPANRRVEIVVTPRR